MNKKLPPVGGQAVIEGVMMRGTNSIATAVRNPENEIVFKKQVLSNSNKKLFKIPFVRGVIALIEALYIGIRELSFSAMQAGEEEGEQKLTKTALTMTVIASLAIGIVVFFFLPAFLGSFAKTQTMQNTIEGAVRIIIFIGYIGFISMLKDVKRIFMYHGAEHKTIYAYEAGEELTVENVQKHSTLHPRCGTSFIIYVLIISIFVFSIVDVQFIHTNNFLYENLIKFLLRIIFLPVVASLAFELQKYSSKHLDNTIIKWIAIPGLWVQKITTNEPTDDQVEVAIVALKASLGEKDIENATEVFTK